MRALELTSLVEDLTQRIAVRLQVAPRPIWIDVVDEPNVSRARVSWPPSAARITMSSTCLTPGRLGHEITHCLVPTTWVFFAEGFATWIGCDMAGDCADLCFGEHDIDDVIRDHE